MVQLINVQHVTTCTSGAHPASYQMDTGKAIRRVKRPGREADQSPHPVPKLRMC